MKPELWRKNTVIGIFNKLEKGKVLSIICDSHRNTVQDNSTGTAVTVPCRLQQRFAPFYADLHLQLK